MFEIGETVRVKNITSGIHCEEGIELYWDRRMNAMIGKTYTVVDNRRTSKISLVDKGGSQWAFLNSWVERANEYCIRCIRHGEPWWVFYRGATPPTWGGSRTPSGNFVYQSLETTEEALESLLQEQDLRQSNLSNFKVEKFLRHSVNIEMSTSKPLTSNIFISKFLNKWSN